ncbi:MAG: hypothetical protein D6741_17040, partial [Planctomycetota bacterium]
RKLGEAQNQILKDAESARELAEAVEVEDVAARTRKATEHMRQAVEAAERRAAEDFDKQAEQAADALSEADKAYRQAEAERTRREQEQQIEKWLQEAAALAAQQRQLLERTQQLQSEMPTVTASDAVRGAWRERVSEVAASQRLVVNDTRRFGGEFASQPVLRTVLGETAETMEQAADRLAAESVDAMTRSLQQAALTRLLHVAEALRQTREASREPETRPDTQNETSSQQNTSPEQQRRAALRLAELKLLKSLQLELNADTAEIDRQIAAAGSSDRFEADLRRLADRQQQIMRWLQQVVAQPQQQPESTPPRDGTEGTPAAPGEGGGGEDSTLPSLDELFSP